MLLPTKHENLKKNLLVVGAEILTTLKKSDQEIEGLFQKIKRESGIDLETYLDTLTYLWLIDFIEVDGNSIVIKKSN